MLPIAPGLAWPVVAPGGLPAGAMPPLGDGLPDTPPDIPPALPAALPPAPAAWAIAIELESANAPANAIVASFMGCFPLLLSGDNPRGVTDVPSLLMNIACEVAHERFDHAIGRSRNYLASVGKIFIRHRFQMRSITAKLVWSAFAPSPGVR